MSESNPPSPIPPVEYADRAVQSAAKPGKIWHGGFICAVIILAAAALGLNLAVSKLRLHFKKDAVPMRVGFREAMPETIGEWVQVARDENLKPELLAALDTDKFLFCSYINAKLLNREPQKVLNDMKGKNLDEQRRKVLEYAKQNPAAVLSVALTYYTGKADTVAHIPERCYVGDGFEPSDPVTVNWELGEDGNHQKRNMNVRFITFENEVGVPRHVAYFFQCNGKYEPDSLMVRKQLQDLFARYGYYAKVEVMCMTDNKVAAEESMKQFLGKSLAHVEKALPVWSEYDARH